MKFNATFALSLATLLPLGPTFAHAARSKAAAAPAAQTYTIDPAVSKITWVGKKVTGQHSGTVKVKGGEVQAQGETLTGGQVEVDMRSLAVSDPADPGMNAKLLGHLKSDDFFGVDKFPTAMFKITSAKPIANATGPTHEVTGDLTIKGQTHPVTFPATITWANGQGQAKANVVIDRTLYGIRYGSGKFYQNLGDKMINDQFELQLDLVASPQK